MFLQPEQKQYPKISLDSKNYPPQLREIAHPPKTLYYRSTPEEPLESLWAKPMIGIVGARRCTQYGKRTTEHIVKGLIRAGVVIVSGMAIGIDAEAHKAALEAGGETIAVVGSGIDESVVYPASNKHLAREIEKSGMVVSEFDPYARSETYFFPQRNRVISGLSLGVVVIEAKEKSGTLITANFALEQNREVFAVPGSIFWENSIGCNNLIKQGARCVTSAEEILGELDLAMPESNPVTLSSKNPLEQKIITALLDKKGEAIHINDIVKKTKLSASETSSTLTLMELDEKIKNTGGDYFVLR